MSQMKKKCSKCGEFRPLVGGKIRYKLFTCKRCHDTCTHGTKSYDKHQGFMVCKSCGVEV